MDYKFKRCVEKGRLARIPISMDMVNKEMDSAKYDLEKSKDSFSRKDFKWTTVQAYYSMFHCSKALLYSKGYREKSHRCLLIAINALFRNTLESRYIQDFSDAMSLREEADYEFIFSENTAGDILRNAERFLERTREILKT